jgi:Ca-activated chloride channel family protein
MPQFDYPWLLLALLILPLLIRRRPVPPAILFNRSGNAAFPRTLRQRWLGLPVALRLAGMAALVLALAGPRVHGRTVREMSQTTGLQLVVDCSGSMLAKDMVFRGKPAARIDVVRELSRDFIFGDGGALKGRPLDMIGVIAFAEEPVTLCPLTLAHESLHPVVNGIRVGSNADGTAIGDAVAVAAARFRQAEVVAGHKFKSTAIVLLTDGDNNSGRHSVPDAAEMAAEWGVRVYAIGIRPGLGLQVRSDDPAVVSLAHLAELTHGKSQMVGNGEALRSVYAEIDRLEKSDVATVRVSGGRELMLGLALIATLLLVSEVILTQTWLRRLP